MFAERVAETVEVAQLAAHGRGRADRERFVPLLSAVEKYVRSQKRVVGGRVATLMLARDSGDREAPLPLDAYHLVVYSPDPLRDASNLARLIYALDPRGLTQYTVMVPRIGTATRSSSSEVRHNEASINVAQRELVRVRGLPRFRGVHIYELIAPETRPSLFTGAATPCLGPEVQLLESYTALCNPGRAGDWPLVLEEERRLREVFLTNFESKVKKKIAEGGRPGGGRPGRGGDALLRDLRQAIVKQFLLRVGRVCLDPIDEAHSSARAACVTVYPLGKEHEALAEIAGRVGANVHFLENDPQLLGDPQLRRLTVYFKGRGDLREPILDVYNIATYEAFPYLRKATPQSASAGYLLATAFGRARFLLVDVWTIQLLWKMGSISEVYALRQLGTLLKRFRALTPALDNPDEAFPALPNHFVGRIEDPELAGKRRAFAAGRAAREARAKQTGKGGKKNHRPGPYYPAWGDRPARRDPGRN